MQCPAGSGVTQRIGGQFADRQYQVSRPRRREPGLLSSAGDEAADRAQVAVVVQFPRPRGRRRQRAVTVRGERGGGPVAALASSCPPLMRSGWVAATSAMTDWGSAVMSYGHRIIAGIWRNARLTSASCRAASCRSATDRPGQTGSLTQVTSLPWYWAAKARTAGMIRAGLRPSVVISIQVTRDDSAPRSARRRSALRQERRRAATHRGPGCRGQGHAAPVRSRAVHGRARPDGGKCG